MQRGQKFYFHNLSISKQIVGKKKKKKKKKSRTSHIILMLPCRQPGVWPVVDEEKDRVDDDSNHIG